MGTENLTNLSDKILLARIQSGDADALAALIQKYPRDAILLARIQNEDDADALTILIKKYEGLLKTIIHYEIRNVDAEEDVYQETVFAITRCLRRKADDIDSAEQWMKQVARSKCKAFLEDAKKHGIAKVYVEEHYAAPQEMQRYLRERHQHKLIDEIREVVEDMGSIYVEVFELWLQGLTEAASAAVLKIPPNTVKSRRNKIRKVVRERLGVSLTPKNRE